MLVAQVDPCPVTAPLPLGLYLWSTDVATIHADLTAAGVTTVVIPRTDASIEEDPGTGLAIVESSVSLPEVVAGLNALGVSARDMIDILKSIKAAGALHAEFVVQ